MTATDTSGGAAGPDEAQLSMGIDPWERNWMRLSALLLIVFFVTVSIAGFTQGFQIIGDDGSVDPRTVTEEAPWSEPGLREVSPGHYEAHVIAQVWSFVPREIEVPVGSSVDIYVTSTDLQHGFKITDTNVNMMVVPGQVSKLSFTFDKAGVFPYICHEYCGQGHASMYGTVRVVDESADASSDSAAGTVDGEAPATDDGGSTTQEEEGS
ncbi:MAG: cytochrome c oxidase subunit II [Acidimicrobiales bacterium]